MKAIRSANSVRKVNRDNAWLDSGATGHHSRSAPSSLLQLQQAVGNQAMIRMLAAPQEPLSGVTMPIMPKLNINDPSDAYELEADQVAFRMVSEINKTQPWDTTIQLAEDQQERSQEKEGFNLDWSFLAALIPDKEQEKKEKGKQTKGQPKPKLQMKPDPYGSRTFEDSSKVENSIQESLGKGDSLPREFRTDLEQAFGSEFTGVTIHTDNNADQLTKSVGARAFTTGRDIYFSQGEFNPKTRGGQFLIAHELTHVLQQNGQS